MIVDDAAAHKHNELLACWCWGLATHVMTVLHFVLQVSRPTWLHLQIRVGLPRRQQFVASYTDTEHHQNTRDIFDIL